MGETNAAPRMRNNALRGVVQYVEGREGCATGRYYGGSGGGLERCIDSGGGGGLERYKGWREDVTEHRD